MIAPWNVRVERIENGPPVLQGLYRTRVRVRGRWFDGGCAKSWWAAFWDGISA
jgi:hypothetical protein